MAQESGEQRIALCFQLQQRGLPPWQRRQLPLLFDGEVLMAAGDRIIAAALQHWLDEHDAQLRWTPGVA